MTLPLALFLTQPGVSQRVSPDAAILLATGGLCLIALELNRPGLIVAGALGLLLVLFGVAGLAAYPVQPLALLLSLGSLGVVGLNLWYKLPISLLTLATAALAAGTGFLVLPSSSDRVHWPVAVSCGVVVGGMGAALSRVALRARRAKRVN